MAERKQVNKYYPPDFDPRKHKNLDKYHNTHALRERAKKIDQGILVIRFEMPYDIWCEGCKIHIAMGVRYNAEKRKMGYYYSTPIYRFRMKCHLCENYFEIETDPMNCNYKIMFGAQRKNEKWDMAENEQVLTEDRQVVKKLAADAMFKLEHGVEDKKKLQKAAPTLSELVDVQSGWHDDYMQNRMLRAKFRKEKKDMQVEESKDRALQVKSSLEIDLVPETEDDKKLAALLKYRSVDSFDEKQLKKRTEIRNQSIFVPPSDSKLSPVDQVDSKTLTLKRLNKQLESAAKANPAGFSIFDDDTAKRRRKAVSSVLVKRRKSDSKRVEYHEGDGPVATEEVQPETNISLNHERLDELTDLSSSKGVDGDDDHRRNDDNFLRTHPANQRDHQLSSTFSKSDVSSSFVAAPPNSDLTSRVSPVELDNGEIDNATVNGMSTVIERPDGKCPDVRSTAETAQMSSTGNVNISFVGDYVTSSSDSE